MGTLSCRLPAGLWLYYRGNRGINRSENGSVPTPSTCFIVPAQLHANQSMPPNESERRKRNPYDKAQMPELHGIWLDGWDSYYDEDTIPPDYSYGSNEERNAWMSGYQSAQDADSSQE